MSGQAAHRYLVHTRMRVLAEIRLAALRGEGCDLPGYRVAAVWHVLDAWRRLFALPEPVVERITIAYHARQGIRLSSAECADIAS